MLLYGFREQLITESISYLDYKKVNLSKVIVGLIYIFVAFAIYYILPLEHKSTGIYYCSTILLSVFFAGLAQCSKSRLNFYIFIALSFIILFFTLGFRNFSGIDDDSYMKIFYDVSAFGWLNKFNETKMEVGYLILNDLVSIFTDKYIYMQLITAFLPLALFYYSFLKYREIINLPLAVFILSTIMYFQVLSVAVIRIFIAMSIIINGFHYIVIKDWKKYVFFVIIAGTFHYSSLFMIILTYFAINKENLSNKYKKFLILVFILTPIIFILISKVIVPILGNRYITYGDIGKLKFSILSMDTIPILLLLICNYNQIRREKSEHFKLLIVIYSLSSIMSFYSSMVPVGRLVFFAKSALFIAAPMVSKAIKGKKRGIIFDIIIIFYGFIYVYYTQFTLTSHIPNLFPYHNIYFTI